MTPRLRNITIVTVIVIMFCCSSAAIGLIGKSTVSYDINYVLNGGTNSSDNPSHYTSGSSVEFKDATREGYIFVGWYSDEELTEEMNSIGRGTTGSITVYAKWETSLVGTMLSFDLTGSYVNTSTSADYGITGMMTFEYLDYVKKDGYQTKLQQYIYMDQGGGDVRGLADKNIRWSSESDDIEPVRGEDTVITTTVSGTITCEKWVFEEIDGSKRNTETQYIYNDIMYVVEVVDVDGTETTTLRYDLTGINDNSKTITTKTFNWNSGGNPYTVTLNVYLSDFVDYRTDDIVRHQVTNDGNVHDLKFVTYDDKYVKQIADYITSVSSAMTTVQKAQIILDFTQTIPYKSDEISMGSNEYWKYPLETLMDGNGDCEDTSILFCSIAKAMGLNCCMFVFNQHGPYEGHMSSGIWIDDSIGKTPMIQSYYYCENTDNDHTFNVGDIPAGYGYSWVSRPAIVVT